MARRALVKVAEQISRESNGRLKLVPMGNGEAASDQKAMQDAIDGRLEIFVSSTTTIVPVHKPLAILDTPFLLSSREEAHALLDGKVGRQLLEGTSD